MTLHLDTALSRRAVLRGGLAAAALLGLGRQATAAPWLDQGFENGWRELVPYPQKMPLLRITTRPVHLETPFSQFDQGLITPNEAVFVRYHLAGHPLDIDASRHTLTVKGLVDAPLTLTLAQLQQRFPTVRLNAVLQCAGNGRGLMQPRTPGAQLGNGSMACAEFTGVRLADVLRAAGVDPRARQLTLRGTDTPALPQTPAFVRSMDLADALHPDVLVAWEMNGQPLPVLNGYPLRLVVPGFYAPYWVKHLSEIELIDHVFTGWFADQAYTVPDTPDQGITPGEPVGRRVRLTRMKVRAFITNLESGQTARAPGGALALRGIAFDGGSGIQQVEVSTDGGRSWQQARLGPELSRYAFRPWSLPLTAIPPGPLQLMARATARDGQVQPLQQPWNPGGYARNVVERVDVTVVDY